MREVFCSADDATRAKCPPGKNQGFAILSSPMSPWLSKHGRFPWMARYSLSLRCPASHANEAPHRWRMPSVLAPGKRLICVGVSVVFWVTACLLPAEQTDVHRILGNIQRSSGGRQTTPRRILLPLTPESMLVQSCPRMAHSPLFLLSVLRDADTAHIRRWQTPSPGGNWQ